MTLPAFITAINLEQKYHCPDCKNTFMFKVELLDRVAEQRDGADLALLNGASSDPSYLEREGTTFNPYKGVPK